MNDPRRVSETPRVKPQERVAVAGLEKQTEQRHGTQDGFRKPQLSTRRANESTQRMLEAYRGSRSEAEDFRLTNTVTMVAKILFNMAAGVHRGNEAAAWAMVENLIQNYTEAKYA